MLPVPRSRPVLLGLLVCITTTTGRTIPRDEGDQDRQYGEVIPNYYNGLRGTRSDIDTYRAEVPQDRLDYGNYNYLENQDYKGYQGFNNSNQHDPNKSSMDNEIEPTTASQIEGSRQVLPAEPGAEPVCPGGHAVDIQNHSKLKHHYKIIPVTEEEWRRKCGEDPDPDRYIYQNQVTPITIPNPEVKTYLQVGKTFCVKSVKEARGKKVKMRCSEDAERISRLFPFLKDKKHFSGVGSKTTIASEKPKIKIKTVQEPVKTENQSNKSIFSTEEPLTTTQQSLSTTDSDMGTEEALLTKVSETESAESVSTQDLVSVTEESALPSEQSSTVTDVEREAKEQFTTSGPTEETFTSADSETETEKLVAPTAETGEGTKQSVTKDVTEESLSDTTTTPNKVTHTTSENGWSTDKSLTTESVGERTEESVRSLGSRAGSKESASRIPQNNENSDNPENNSVVGREESLSTSDANAIETSTSSSDVKKKLMASQDVRTVTEEFSDVAQVTEKLSNKDIEIKTELMPTSDIDNLTTKETTIKVQPAASEDKLKLDEYISYEETYQSDEVRTGNEVEPVGDKAPDLATNLSDDYEQAYQQYREPDINPSNSDLTKSV